MKLSSEHINELLASHTGTLKATIYIPTSPIPNEQDKTRLKNALQIIKDNPVFDDRELGDTYRKIYAELLEDDDFWRFQDYGLAVLFDRDGYEYFHLPFEIAEAEYLTDHFIISPMIIMASADTGFYLLDINFTKPRLFSGSRGSLREVLVKDMPKSFDNVMGRSSFKNHSLGGEDNAINEDEKKYLQLIATAVADYMPHHNRALIIAGTSNRIGHIKPLLQHGHILNESLVGNFETTDSEQLYREVNAVLRPALMKERDEIATQVLNTAPQFVVIGVNEIVEAANIGRVSLLVIPSYKVTADTVQQDVSERVVLELPANIEDIEPMVRVVIEKGGEVTSVELDKYDHLQVPKAICRY